MLREPSCLVCTDPCVLQHFTHLCLPVPQSTCGSVASQLCLASTRRCHSWPELHYACTTGHTMPYVLPSAMLLCCCAGKSINLAEVLPGRGFSSGSLRCPDSRVVCPQLSCKQPCVNGQCYKGRCICDMEYTGEGCEKNLVPGWT